jgi:predicted AlkP superfamily phosphohydrolase/phosphomutase
VQERLTDGRDRHGPSVWQILSRFGRRSLVVNYQIGSPPEEINGVFLTPGSPVMEEVTAPLRTVSLRRLPGLTRQIRVDFEVAEEEFARSAAVTGGLLTSDSFDLVTFYTSWPDWFNHLMSLQDYKDALDGRFEAGFPAVLLGAYERIDDFVGQLRSIAPNANLIVLSDHGVGTGYRFRQRRLQHVLGCPGVIVAHGPDVATRGAVPAVSMYDLTPTVLSYFGIPVAQDMHGRARQDLIVLPQYDSRDLVASYQAIVANRRRSADDAESEAMLERLKALGYVQR